MSSARPPLASLVARPRPARTRRATIKIGEINSYKAQPAFLDPYKKGMDLAVEEINAAGGVDGKKLELITRDDNASPGDAVRAAEELISREKIDVLAGTFLSNTGLALADFAKQKKFFFLAGEPLTDKIIWGSGNKYTFRLRPGTYMQAAMLVPEAVKLKKKRWALVYPNYEYGQSAVAAFKELLKAAQPDVEFVAEQATPLGKLDAGSVVQALADAKPDAIFNVLFGADLSKFVREGNTRGLFQGREVVSVLTGEPEYLDPLKDETPERLDRHRLPVVRHPDAGAQGLLPRLPREVQRLPAPRLGGRLHDDQVDRGRRQEGQEHRRRQAGRGVLGPAGRVAVRQDHATAPEDHQSTMGAFVGTTKNEGGKGVMVDYSYLDGAKFLPTDARVKKLAPRTETGTRTRRHETPPASSSSCSTAWPAPRRCSWSARGCR